jgi:hypothetical protein
MNAGFAFGQLGPQLLYCAWLLAGVLGAAANACFGYFLVRRVLGYRKFRGSWYAESEYRELMRLIYRDSQRGLPMPADEIRALREWMHAEPAAVPARNRLNIVAGPR